MASRAARRDAGVVHGSSNERRRAGMTSFAGSRRNNVGLVLADSCLVVMTGRATARDSGMIERPRLERHRRFMAIRAG